MELNVTFFIQLILFLGLLAWLGPVLFKPMLRLYDERERRIEGAAEEARTLKIGLAAKEGEIGDRTREAHEAARAVFTKMREETLAEERNTIGKAKSQANARLQDARKELKSAGTKAEVELKVEADKIAAKIAEKVLGRVA